MPPPIRRLLYLLFALTSAVLCVAASSSAGESALAGRWRIDLARSTELSPWKAFDLIIEISGGGNVVRIQRELGWGRRKFTETMELDLRQKETRVPVEWWADNRHLGAYIGEEKFKRVRAEWLDGRRILRVSADLTLEAQQGPRAVNILSDYKVSGSGAELTLTELRSTRNRPVVYVFKRVQ